MHLPSAAQSTACNASISVPIPASPTSRPQEDLATQPATRVHREPRMGRPNVPSRRSSRSARRHWPAVVDVGVAWLPCRQVGTSGAFAARDRRYVSICRICSSVNVPPNARLHAGISVPGTPPAMRFSTWGSVVPLRNCCELSTGALPRRRPCRGRTSSWWRTVGCRWRCSEVCCAAAASRAQRRFTDAVDDEAGDQHRHEDEAGDEVPVEAAVERLGLERRRRRSFTGHGSGPRDARRALRRA